MIIDFHTHIHSPQMKANRDEYLRRDPDFAVLYANPKAKMVTVEELINSMDEAGIDVSVVLNFGWSTQSLCVETNDYILESIARYPKRLIGFCAVQPNSVESAIAEIERCARSGARGIGELRPDTQHFDLEDDRATEPLVEALMKYRLILLTHASEPVGHSYPGKGEVTPDKLYPFITRYPGLTVVCAHWGGGLPFYALMPEVKRTLHNVLFDAAASPFLYSPQIYRQVIELVGADKILFGTDYPLMPQSRVLKEVQSLNLPDDTRNLILSGNARRILDIRG